MLSLNFLFLIAGGAWQIDTVTVEINKSESSWYYIVPSTKIDELAQMATNADGVCFMNTKRFSNLRKPIFHRDGKDVTTAVRFLSRVSSNESDVGGTTKSYRLITFYLSENLNSECCPPPSEADPDVYRKFSKEEQKHRDKLIQEGKIRFE